MDGVPVSAIGGNSSMVLFDPSQLHEEAQAARRQQRANETVGGPVNLQPDAALEQAAPIQVMEKEHVFFLLKPLLEPLIRETEKLHKQLAIMVEDLYRSRHFIDSPVSIGLTIAYEVDYHERHMLFVYTTAATTFVLNSGGTIGPTTP